MEWVDIDQQKPEESQQCLVYLSKGKDIAFGIWIDNRWFSGGMFGDSDWFTELVSHWMPMPAPPVVMPNNPLKVEHVLNNNTQCDCDGCFEARLAN